MKKIRWFYKNGSFEEYSVLFEDNRFILVQNDKTKKYSFGPRSDFDSFYGFPVNNSCLTDREIISQLHNYIDIDNGFDLISVGRWKCMIEAVMQHS